MTQDLKDLCLIKKSSLNRLARAYNYEYGVDDDDAMQALAQDLSGMRLVAPPPQTDDELFKSPWYEFAKEAYYDMGNGYAHPRVHAAFARQIFLKLPAAPGLETEEPKA
jgi:hypothetical protein